MKIKRFRPDKNGWFRFNFNIGGFTIKACRWHPRTRRIFFPLQYRKWTRKYSWKTVFTYGAQVKRLRNLLESNFDRLRETGECEARRNRKPCLLKIHWNFGISKETNKDGRRRDWIIFDFTVRGFKIMGSRWDPVSGSIQLPATYLNGSKNRLVKKPIVCAYGAHINRLRVALEAAIPAEYRPRPVIEAVRQPDVPLIEAGAQPQTKVFDMGGEPIPTGV